MKLKKYIVVSLLLLMAISTFACGWEPSRAEEVLLYRIMPLDETDYFPYGSLYGCDRIFHQGVNYEDEMITLWKQETSSVIRSKDIRFVVYKADISYLKNIKKAKRKNSFAKWLIKHQRNDIISYLILAKQREEVVSSMNNPWYYSVDDDKQSQILENIVNKCRAYKEGPLFSRYILQMVRALYAQRKYQECVELWRKNENNLTNNVIRKIIELKTAGALYKIGNKLEALKIYAKYGDVSSIRTLNDGRIENELEYVYNLQPNSPYLAGELQKWLIFFGGDWIRTSEDLTDIYSNRFYGIIKVAKEAINNKATENKAMWYYTLAALYDAIGKTKEAMWYLNRGDRCPKTPFLKDSYHILHMWLEAKTAVYNTDYEHELFADLRWLVSKIKNEVPKDFQRKMTPRNSFDWNKGYQDYPNSFYWNDAMRRIILRVICPRMHKAKKYVREIQLSNMAENLLLQINGYSNEMFQIVDRLSYSHTKDYFYRIYHPKDAFDVFLNSKGKLNKYYWYDILATKCIREQRYSKAIVYLRQIPLSFQKRMDVYKYMDKDPFSYDMETFKSIPSLARNYKLHFARKMVSYKQTMTCQHNPNIRADAKIMYAIGLRNSVHRCWFLTRHSSNLDNSYVTYNLPKIAYPTDSAVYRCEKYKNQSDKLINQAINTYQDKEKAARQLRKLLYFKRIMDRFGDTETARDIRKHCDRWKDYVSKARLLKT